MASATKSGGFLKNAKIIWLGIAVLLIFVFVGTFMFLRSIYETETYYVLNQDVPTRTAITMDMLTPVVTSHGTAPGGTPEMTQEEKDAERSAILSAVQTGSAYSQFPLKSGDTLSPSNLGALSDISVGIPDDWVVTSFNVDYNSAVQGRIDRGTYFDIMVVGDEGAYYPFVNVLALETATGEGTSSAGSEDESGMNSTTSVYTVGMSPENAAKLQFLQKNVGGDMKLVLSPRQNEYASPLVEEYTGLFTYDPTDDGVIAPGIQTVVDADGNELDLDGDGVADTREITDYTFSDIERDQFGRPLEVVENVGLGNAKIPSGSPVDSNDEDSDTAATETASPEPSEEPSETEESLEETTE